MAKPADPAGGAKTSRPRVARSRATPAACALGASAESAATIIDMPTGRRPQPALDAGKLSGWSGPALVRSEMDLCGVLRELHICEAEPRVSAEDALAEAASRHLALTFDAAKAGLWDWNVDRQTICLSVHCCRILGIEPDGVDGMSLASLVHTIHPGDLRRVVEHLERRFGSGADEAEIEFRIVSGERVAWLRGMGRVAARHGDGRPRRVVGALSDITARKHAEEQLRIAAVAFQTSDAMVVTDAAGVILQVNKAFTEVTGYGADEAVGKTPALMKSGRHGNDFYRTLWEAVTREGHWEGEIWNRRKDGAVYAEWLSISRVRDESGATSHYLGTFSDISDPRERERKIVELAFYDPLTGLPNRRLLMDRLRQALASSSRTDEFGAVLLLDLDHFKILNDTRGHTVGDELLNTVARRLRASLRESDSAARLGGDEFVVLLERLNVHQFAAANLAEAIAEKLRVAIGTPMFLDGKEYRITPSIGIALFRGQSEDADRLLRQADLALYQAKDAGRNAIRFYSPEMQAAVDSRAEMETGLRRALEEGEFELHYQPKVELKRGRVVGAEALIRWRDESGKLVPPNAFIPAAEETGLIVPIGEWVIETACQQMAEWRRAGLPPLRVAVNVSALQFQQLNLAQVVAQALRINELEPQWLELELTESAVMANPERTAAVLQELKAIGVYISLDDFGTGYSSLGHLKRFPIDSLKIDRSFVQDITTDADDAAIAEMIIGLAHTLKQTVVAEGVETEEQLAFLQRLRCDEMQGYFFSRPLPATGFTALLRSQPRLGSATARPAVQELLA